MSCWHDHERAADAADDLVRYALGLPPLSPLAKRSWSNPLSRTGFATLIRGVAKALYDLTRPEDSKALALAMQGLDLDWGKKTTAQRDAAIAKAMGAILGVPKVLAPKIGKVLLDHGKGIVADTKRANKDRYELRIDPSFTQIDGAIIQHAASSQAHYIRDQYGKRHDQLSAVARDVVAKGLEAGFDHHDIGKALKQAITGTAADRSEAYCRMVATVFAGRARTYATASSLHEAGIPTMEFVAVGDEVTCDICDFFNGQVIGTAHTLARFEQVAMSPDPEAVERLQPFAGIGRDEQGKYLYHRTGDGGRNVFARVEQSTYGKVDTPGKYSSTLDRAGLEKSGMSPPVHAMCRCTLIGGFGDDGGDTMAPATVQPAAPGFQSALALPTLTVTSPAAPAPSTHAASSPIPVTYRPVAPVQTVTPASVQVLPAKRPRDKAQAGVHFGDIQAAPTVSKAEQGKILSALDQPLLAFLRKKPVDLLGLGAGYASSKGAAGIYAQIALGGVKATALDVETTRDPLTYMWSLRPGTSQSFSSTGPTLLGAIQRTLIHELGHHVHLSAGIDVDKIVRAAFIDRGSRPLTQYAGTSPIEYFAESFAAYHFNRSVLRKHDPVGYKMVRTVRKMTGVDP